MLTANCGETKQKLETDTLRWRWV